MVTVTHESMKPSERTDIIQEEDEEEEMPKTGENYSRKTTVMSCRVTVQCAHTTAAGVIMGCVGKYTSFGC